MKYYLIAGEASGDLHASNLMRELQKTDSQAEFRFFGGDLMQEVGGTLVRHYKKMAFMGFLSVLNNLRTVLNNINTCKKDISTYQPDVLILVDYPSFNLKIAKFVKQNFPNIPVYFYISPKIWAWKEYRIKSIKKYIDHIFSILPFEIEFYKKHNYAITYVGNPSVDAIRKFEQEAISFDDFINKQNLSSQKIIAVLAGSRKQEIKKCLPIMLEVAKNFPQYQFIIAGAPGIEKEFYEEIINKNHLLYGGIVFNATYALLQNATAALINSGTASLEAALIKTPQIVGYHVSGGIFARKIFEKIIRVPWASLVNLIVEKEAVKEFLADRMTSKNLSKELNNILTNEDYKQKMLSSYQEVKSILGDTYASEKAAKEIFKQLNQR